jgi:hypothetical protein
MMHFQNYISHYFKRTALVLAALSILTACSLVTTLYQNATTLAMLEIDAYFDLSAEQDQLGKVRTDAMMAWHKREVLPLYVKQLRSLASKAEQGLSGAEVTDTLDWGLNEFRRISTYTAPQQAELLTSLSDKQIAYLQKKLAKEDKKYRKDWLDASQEDALELRFDKFITWVERIYGNLTVEQKSRIRQLSDQRSYNAKIDFAERLARQAQFVTMLKTFAKDKPSPELAQASIASFIASVEKASPHTVQRRQELTVLIAAITQIATPEQRLNAKTTLLNYASTFESISRGR